MDALPRPPRPPSADITLDDIRLQAEACKDMMAKIRIRSWAPDQAKSAPRFVGAQVAALCGIDKHALTRRIARGDLPTGQSVNAARREFSLAEVRQWTKAHSRCHVRVAGERAITVAIGNFKGGVSKTTTAMGLAQGLSLKGYNVLLIDTDPQGSLTSLCGLQPEDLQEADTILPLCAGLKQSVREAIRPTYWDGISIVPACPLLFGADFQLPARSINESNSFRFWDVLNQGLSAEGVRDDFDVIVIDTPPSLSYLALNAFFAADGLIMPLPPSALDFASAAQFWTLFGDLTGHLEERRPLSKTFKFVDVLLARVRLTDPAAPSVTKWIAKTYGDKVLPVEIPETNVANVSSTQFGTLYDLTKYAGSAKTYQRAREAFDRVVDLVDGQVRACWPSAAA